ncbi:MAG: S41 family peptidase [Patescibacteria group bacterium]
MSFNFKEHKRLLVICLFLLFLSFLGGYTVAIKGYRLDLKNPQEIKITRGVPQDKKVDFALFWKVWDTLNQIYLDKTQIDPTKMVYGAIKGMVASIGDPYTSFLPPDENKVITEDLSGSFDGVGIQIGFKGTQLAVISPLPGTPADKAGLKSGDFIMGIKDEAKNVDRGTVGINLSEAVQLIRGKRGTTVTLTILRSGEEKALVIDLVRENIDVPSVIVSFVGEDEKISHLKLSKFGGDTQEEWRKAVLQVKGQDARAVILDLRNNPGGYLQGGVNIAAEFLPTASVVVIEENSRGEKKEFKAERKGDLLDIPLIVLVNKGSASASEILAGSLKDYKRAKIVGEVTFGKGTVQEPIALEGGAGLHVTTFKWLTPSGFWVHNVGLEPDVKIEDKQDTKEDEQLEEAIKLLQND